MSVEYFGYSEDPTPVSIDDVLVGCRDAAFECQVIREQSGLAESGPLMAEDVIIGWKCSLFGNRTARRAASAADWKALDGLQEQNAIGVCSLEIWADPGEFNDVADIEEAGEVYGADFAVYRRKSQVRWYIRLASGSSELSATLAVVVLKTLLHARGGVFVDPQSGAYQMFDRHEDRA